MYTPSVFGELAYPYVYPGVTLVHEIKAWQHLVSTRGLAH